MKLRIISAWMNQACARQRREEGASTITKMHFKIKTHPGSKKPKIIKKAEDSFDIFVKEKAEKGLANKAVIKTLSSYLKLPAGKLRLIKGAKSRNKIFKVE